MGLKDVKIRVQTARDGDKIRCFFAESIASIDEIYQSVRRRFAGIEVVDIYYWGEFQIICSLN